MTQKLQQRIGQLANTDLKCKWDEIGTIIGDYKTILQSYLTSNPLLSTAQIDKIMKVLNRRELINISTDILLQSFSYLTFKETRKYCRISKYIKNICDSSTPSFLSISDIKNITNKSYLFQNINKLTKIHRFHFDIHCNVDLTFLNQLFSKRLPNLTHIFSKPLIDWDNNKNIQIAFNMHNYPNLLVFDCMTEWNYPSLPSKLHTLSVNIINSKYILLLNNVEYIKLNIAYYEEFYDNLLLNKLRKMKLENNKLKCLININQNGFALDINIWCILNNPKSLISLHINNSVIMRCQENQIKPITLSNLKTLCITHSARFHVGDFLQTPNVITMACDAAVNNYLNFITTLKKLGITKLRYLRLYYWDWLTIYRLVIGSRQSSFVNEFKNCIEYPFYLHVFAAEGKEEYKNDLLCHLLRDDAKIRIKYNNKMLTHIKDDNEIWELYEIQQHIKCDGCSRFAAC